MDLSHRPPGIEPDCRNLSCLAGGYALEVRLAEESLLSSRPDVVEELQPIQVAMDCKTPPGATVPGLCSGEETVDPPIEYFHCSQRRLLTNVAKEILGSSPKLPTPVGSQPWLWRKYWKGDASPCLRS